MNWEWVVPGAVVGLGVGVLGQKAGWPLWITAVMAMFLAGCGALFAWLMEPVVAKWAAALKSRDSGGN